MKFMFVEDQAKAERQNNNGPFVSVEGNGIRLSMHINDQEDYEILNMALNIAGRRKEEQKETK